MQARGFTLLELTISIAVLATFLAAGLLTFRNLSTTTDGEEGAARIAALARLAQRTADSTGRGVIIELNAGSAELRDQAGVIQDVLLSEQTLLQTGDGRDGWATPSGQIWRFEPRQLCDPIRLRVSEGTQFAEIQIDPLTALALPTASL